MRIVESKPAEWILGDKGQFLTPEGLTVTCPQGTGKHDIRRDICDFSGVPATLIGVDDRFGTHTMLDVLQASGKTTQFMVDDNNQILSVLDPRSKFMDDADFDKAVNMIQDQGLVGKEQPTRTLSRRVLFELKDDDKKDTFEGDVFHKRLVFERLREGGCYFGIQLLRLACTNGALVSEGQVKKVIRSAKVDEDLCKFFVNQGNGFFVKKFLHDMFFDKSGAAYQASVANYLGMRDAMLKATDEGLAKEFFPLEPITEHYEAQGISISGAPRAILDHLPSGLEYYKCFNILTHGIKSAEDLRLEDEIAIGDWASERKLKFVRANNVSFEGMPHFNETYVRHLMGDVA